MSKELQCLLLGLITKNSNLLARLYCAYCRQLQRNSYMAHRQTWGQWLGSHSAGSLPRVLDESTQSPVWKFCKNTNIWMISKMITKQGKWSTMEGKWIDLKFVLKVLFRNSVMQFQKWRIYLVGHPSYWPKVPTEYAELISNFICVFPLPFFYSNFRMFTLFYSSHYPSYICYLDF